MDVNLAGLDTDSDHEENIHNSSMDDVTSAVELKLCLLDLKSAAPDQFVLEQVQSIHGIVSRAGSQLVKLKLQDWSDLQHTWLIDLESSDIVNNSAWTSDQLMKMNTSPFMPSLNSALPFPRRLNVKFPSKVMEDYFEASMIGSKATKGIKIPSVHFMKDKFKLPTSDDPKFELWGRKGVLDCQITHELLNLESNLIKSMAGLLDSLEVTEENAATHKAIGDKLKLFINVNGLALQSNFRARSWASTTSCKAKLNIRDSILQKTAGDPVVSEALRGSCFLNEGIFGPIPQVTQELVNAFPSREETRLSFVSSASTAKKRPASSQHRGNAKRRVVLDKSAYMGLYNTPYNQPTTSYVSQPPSTSQVATSPALFHTAKSQGHRGKNKKGKGFKR